MTGISLCTEQKLKLVNIKKHKRVEARPEKSSFGNFFYLLFGIVAITPDATFSLIKCDFQMDCIT